MLLSRGVPFRCTMNMGTRVPSRLDTNRWVVSKSSGLRPASSIRRNSVASGSGCFKSSLPDAVNTF